VKNGHRNEHPTLRLNYCVQEGGKVLGKKRNGQINKCARKEMPELPER
jgi:hypothetical protein